MFFACAESDHVNRFIFINKPDPFMDGKEFRRIRLNRVKSKMGLKEGRHEHIAFFHIRLIRSTERPYIFFFLNPGGYI